MDSHKNSLAVKVVGIMAFSVSSVSNKYGGIFEFDFGVRT